MIEFLSTLFAPRRRGPARSCPPADDRRAEGENARGERLTRPGEERREKKGEAEGSGVDRVGCASRELGQ